MSPFFSDGWLVWINETHMPCLIARISHRHITHFLRSLHVYMATTTHHVSDHLFDLFWWVLKKRSTSSSEIAFLCFLPVLPIHAFVTAFSITDNQRRDYYDSIQCALMVGGNLPPKSRHCSH